MKRVKLITLLLLFIFILLAACSDKESGQTAEQDKQEKPEQQSEEPAEPENQDKEITISAIGDLLIHDSVYRDAKASDTYNFMKMFDQVAPYLKDSTITMANQETMIGGEELGLSSYPQFNSPFAVGDALKQSGVDVVTIANNHTLDGGEEAIKRAINHWEKINMMYTGAYKSKADSNQLRIYETEEGISVAFLAFTYGTNGLPVPEGKNYLVNLIDRQLIASRIEEAKKQADAVILSLHFGNEYERLPSERQKELAQFAADEGVHAVIGHHPHVLQPVEWVKGENGNKTLVAYSLGNFLSGQDEFYRRIGGMLKFTIKKNNENGNGSVEITSPKFLPTFVKYQNWSDYEIVPMHRLSNDELTNASKHYQEIKNHMAQWMPELEFIEEK
ncbi:CapA family protein [Virgibacillus kekensis]|uniref:CapA family protein n=1 Tax=Virgibacillus kekensis TaxID=202261 RepID=A0ABV9DNZ9_9BACI